jgi:DHA3 family macrolide efflux protein-like MFS transporter
LLRNHNFLILLVGVFVAEMGIWFGLIGNLDFLQKNVDSSFLQAMILLIGVFVGALLSPLAGRLIDQIQKKKILIYCGITRILAVGFMFVALELNSIWWMIGYNLLIGVSAAFYFPALQALTPIIVDKNDLLKANGMQTNANTIARILGAGAAGFLLVIISLYYLYLFALIAYVFLLISTILLQINERHVSEDKNLNQIAKFKFLDIIPVIKTKPIVIISMILVLVPYFFNSGFNLMVIAISDLQDDSTIKGVLYTVEGICMMLGAFFINRISKNKNLLLLMLFMSLLIGISHTLLFFAEFKIVSIISFGLFGFALGGFLPLASTIHQMEVPRDYHGRFFAFKRMVESIIYQALMMLTGLFLDTIGFHTMVVVFGMTSVLLVIAISFRYTTYISINKSITFKK